MQGLNPKPQLPLPFRQGAAGLANDAASATLAVATSGRVSQERWNIETTIVTSAIEPVLMALMMIVLLLMMMLVLVLVLVLVRVMMLMTVMAIVMVEGDGDDDAGGVGWVVLVFPHSIHRISICPHHAVVMLKMKLDIVGSPLPPPPSPPPPPSSATTSPCPPP